MDYAKIAIRVMYDETKLTEEQRKQADSADRDIHLEHPLEKGMGEIDDILSATMDGCFMYLGEGRKAVTVSWDSD